MRFKGVQQSEFKCTLVYLKSMYLSHAMSSFLLVDHPSLSSYLTKFILNASKSKHGGTLSLRTFPFFKLPMHFVCLFFSSIINNCKFTLEILSMVLRIFLVISKFLLPDSSLITEELKLETNWKTVDIWLGNLEACDQDNKW